MLLFVLVAWSGPRYRVSAASLHLDLESFSGFGLMSGFGVGLGLALEPRGVFAAGLTLGSLCCEALRGIAGERQQLVEPRCPVVLPGLRCAVGLGLAAPPEFGSGFPGGFPGGVGVCGPLLVPGITGLEPLPFGGQPPGEGFSAGRAGFVMRYFGGRGLLERVGFGLCGKAQCPGNVRRSAGLGTFAREDS